MGNFLVRYASRVVIYDHRAVIRLATDLMIANYDSQRTIVKFVVCATVGSLSV